MWRVNRLTHYTTLAWMTLLEVMTALLVFGTGVLVIMLTMTKNIARVQEIKLKTTATMLAKEWIETMYYLRDTNIKQAMYRDCVEKDEQTSACLSRLLEQWAQEAKYVVSVNLSWTMSVLPLTDTQNGKLYLKSSDQGSVRYVNEPGEITPYTRVITILPVPAFEQSTDKILAIRSSVSYAKWNTTGEVILESFIGSLK